MEQRKETPKKFYLSIDFESKCRLCGNVFDRKHGKNLFLKSNKRLLGDAEIVNGGTLPHEEGLPSHICRPCERRLSNFNKYRKIVCEVQSSLVRKKRCIDLSPSAPISSAKSSRAQSTVSSRRRSLNFGPVISDESNSSTQV
jgi:hypothetical protein